MLGILHKVFGSRNDRELKRLEPIVARINELEPEIQGLTDNDLKTKSEFFKRHILKVR